MPFRFTVHQGEKPLSSTLSLEDDVMDSINAVRGQGQGMTVDKLNIPNIGCCSFRVAFFYLPVKVLTNSHIFTGLCFAVNLFQAKGIFQTLVYINGSLRDRLNLQVISLPTSTYTTPVLRLVYNYAF